MNENLRLVVGDYVGARREIKVNWQWWNIVDEFFFLLHFLFFRMWPTRLRKEKRLTGAEDASRGMLLQLLIRSFRRSRTLASQLTGFWLDADIFGRLINASWCYIVLKIRWFSSPPRWQRCTAWICVRSGWYWDLQHISQGSTCGQCW